MAVYDLRNQPGSGNLAAAMGAWNTFFGPQAQATKQATQQSKQLFPAELQQQTAQGQAAAQTQESNRNALAANEVANGLTEDSLNKGFETPISHEAPRFWSQLSEPEQRYVQKTFAVGDSSHGRVADGSVVPDAYNSWVSRQYHVAQPLMMPLGGFPGMGVTAPQTNNGSSIGTSGFSQVPELSFGQDGMHMGFARIPNPLTDKDRQQIHDDPVNAPAMFPELQRPAAESYAKNLTENLNHYQTEVSKDPRIQSYLTGSGDQSGIRPLWQLLDQFRSEHTNKDGTMSDLSPQEAKKLIYSAGRFDNPGSIVRQQEFETIAKGSAGVYDNIVAGMHQAATGQGVPASVVKDLYNVIDQMKGNAQQQFNNALVGWEPELQQRGLKLSDVIHDRPALDEFYNDYGPMVSPDQIQQATSGPNALPVFHLPGGQIVRKTGGDQQQQQQQQAGLPPVSLNSTQPPGIPPNVTNAMMSRVLPQVMPQIPLPAY